MSGAKPFRLGVILESKWETEKSVEFARLAEESGYDDIWINDYIFDYDPFAVLARLSAETKRARLGTGVVNPYVRHPAILATSIGTLANSSKGRAVLGIGSSVNVMLKPIEVDVDKPVETCKEAIEIVKLLLKGERATYKGSRFKLQDAKLSFKFDGEVPIFLGLGTGRKMMLLCGEVADGAFLMEATTGFYKETMKTIEEGFAKANRGRPAFEVLVNQLICVEENRKDAFEQLRPVMATNLTRKGPGAVEMMGLDKEKWSRYTSDYKTIPDEFLSEFALCGNVDDCLEHIDGLRKAGITQVAHRFPTLDQVGKAGRLLVPALREQFGS